jgi:hypothetical protein
MTVHTSSPIDQLDGTELDVLVAGALGFTIQHGGLTPAIVDGMGLRLVPTYSTLDAQAWPALLQYHRAHLDWFEVHSPSTDPTDQQEWTCILWWLEHGLPQVTTGTAPATTEDGHLTGPALAICRAIVKHQRVQASSVDVKEGDRE